MKMFNDLIFFFHKFHVNICGETPPFFYFPRVVNHTYNVLISTD